MTHGYHPRMSIAATTREAARGHPFLLHALRAGVVNYAAAATFLDVDGDTDAVATALRRYAEELPEFRAGDRDARVTMRSGVGLVEERSGGQGALLSVGDLRVVPDAGSRTAVLATGDVDAGALGAVCSRLSVADVDVEAAGVAGDVLVVVVGRREGATTVRIVEAALATVPG